MSLQCARCLLKVASRLQCSTRVPSLIAVATNRLLDTHQTTVRHSTTEAFSFKGKDVVKKLAQRFRFTFDRQKSKAAGFFLYEKIADRLDYEGFLKELELPDTFQSWFILTELHVWMLMARVMGDQEHGRVVRNAIVEALWQDVAARAKKLDPHNQKAIREQIAELSEQFQAALVSYDEGLLTDDKVLACAIWRRIFNSTFANPEHLEALVRYVRKTMYTLDKLNSHEFIMERKFTWSPATEVFRKNKIKY